MELVFATHNKNKVTEIRELLPQHITLLSLDDIGCTEDIPETAATLRENAQLKAGFVAENYGLDCFADDTGLMVDFLNGAPGVYSARYAGNHNDAEANMDKLLLNMAHATDRSAHFTTVIALHMAGKTMFFEGKVHGSITQERMGTKGFGYDPLFLPTGYDKTFAQLPLEVKNKIGHRGKAFLQLITHLSHVTDEKKQ
jgi:XTP/dITP diphosphohydrolase